MGKIYIETNNGDSVIISGNISTILNHRRANRLLQDTLNCEIFTDKIIVSNVTDFTHCFNRINRVAEICRCEVCYSDDANEEINKYLTEENRFALFSEKALSIRNNNCNLYELNEFKNSLIDNLPNRTLYDLQLLAAYHLAFSQNACNFSVPGAGKTSVVYGAYAYLKNLSDDNIKKIDKLLIIGPLSSFGPWEMEYNECFGSRPYSRRLSGQLSLETRKQYFYEKETAEITLISYASVMPLLDDLKYFLKNNKVMVVLDEAHKIKNINGGIYAQSVLALAELASSRVVLTGTPAPNGYEDLYNLFKFIWPTKKIIKFQPGQLRDMSRNDNDARVSDLINQISPYFMRVKKSDLNIPKAIVHPPILVPMKENQRRIYDFIEENYIHDLIDARDRSFKSVLVRARIVRLLQAASNPALLKRPLKEFADEEGIDLTNYNVDESIIGDVLTAIRDEVPAKFETACEISKKILANGGKVVIWACYIETLNALSKYLFQQNLYNKILYGATPVAGDIIDPDSDEYASTREAIITEFNAPNSGLNIIIANPFAVAESISLHKACHNAIYLERSFNAAHFIQSKDRIHRYGLPEGTVTNYYYLVSSDSIDEVVNSRLEIKENRLIQIMESMPIPLFSNYLADNGSEDIKAILRNYARRIKAQ